MSTPPALLPISQHLDVAHGPGGLQLFIRNITNLISRIDFAGTEFLTATYTSLPEPHPSDLQQSDLDPDPFEQDAPLPTSPVTPIETEETDPPSSVASSKPATGKSSGAKTRGMQSAAGTDASQPASGASGPSYEYQHDQHGVLTQYGLTRFDTARDTWKKAGLLLRSNRILAFFYLLDNMTQSSLTTLDNSASFVDIRAKTDVVRLRLLLNSSHSQGTLIRSLYCMQSFLACRQGPHSSFSDFVHRLRNSANEVGATFDSDIHPGYIKRDTLHIAILLTGLNASFKPQIESMLTQEKGLQDLSLPTLVSDLQHYSTNMISYAAATSTTSTKTVPFVAPGKPKPIPTNALGTTAPPRAPSLWTISHPHTRAPGDGHSPGDPTKPHCGHCIKNGTVFNNHGFIGARFGIQCADQIRCAQPGTPSPAPVEINSPLPLRQLPAAHPQAALISSLQSLLTPSNVSHMFDAAALHALDTSPGYAISAADATV